MTVDEAIKYLRNPLSWAIGKTLEKQIADNKEATQMAIDALEKQRWIPCSERLPRQGQEVICQCRANMIKVLKLDAYGDWYQDADHCYMGGFVIAWMSLPEPYKGGTA